MWGVHCPTSTFKRNRYGRCLITFGDLSSCRDLCLHSFLNEHLSIWGLRVILRYLSGGFNSTFAVSCIFCADTSITYLPRSFRIVCAQFVLQSFCGAGYLWVVEHLNGHLHSYKLRLVHSVFRGLSGICLKVAATFGHEHVSALPESSCI